VSEENISPSPVRTAGTDSPAADAAVTGTATPETAVTDTAGPPVTVDTATDSTGAPVDERGDAPVDEQSEQDAADADAVGAGDSRASQDEEDDDEVSELDTEAEVAADFLEEFLDIADLDGDIDTYIENGRAQVSIVTDSQTLVGKDGEVLEALQEVVRLAVMAETDNRTRLMLDVAGFREKRRTTLRALASDAVQEVRASGEAVRLSPMNPFERKIVHDTVAEAGLTSESEGTEPQRRVVVQPGT